MVNHTLYLNLSMTPARTWLLYCTLSSIPVFCMVPLFIIGSSKPTSPVTCHDLRISEVVFLYQSKVRERPLNAFRSRPISAILVVSQVIFWLAKAVCAAPEDRLALSNE